VSQPDDDGGRDQSALSTSYRETLFEIETPDGKATLRVENVNSTLPDWLRGRPVAVVTAYNPGMQRPNETTNLLANRRLRAVIEQRGWSYWTAVGRSPSGDHAEPSFAVLDLTEDEARELGAQFDQACVFYWDREQGRLLWCQ
jgi:hypothetical protein